MDILNITELAKLVWQMRQAQTNYLQYRTRTNLFRAKLAEQRVDAAILKLICGDTVNDIRQEA